jgi:peptidyl-prolyl cis-trans isomerase B (cyclophilin B)
MITLHTNFGEIGIELNYEQAPNTAKNFVQLAKDGFYDGLIFHRVIAGFMVQGGGFTASMKHKDGIESIQNEADNSLKNNVYTVAMARTMDPHSASSQFFINLSDNDFLNHTTKTMEGWGYCVFAEVTVGMNVVKQIGGVTTTIKAGHQDVPAEDIYIESVTIEDTDIQQIDSQQSE